MLDKAAKNRDIKKFVEEARIRKQKQDEMDEVDRVLREDGFILRKLDGGLHGRF